MKATITVEKEIELDSIQITLPVRYGEEDIPNDFPLRNGDVWSARINLDTGAIQDWPKGRPAELSMKVCDEGSYLLLDKDGSIVAELDQDYVPHGVVPGRYGDYVDLKINEEGIVTNWPKHPDLTTFLGE